MDTNKDRPAPVYDGKLRLRLPPDIDVSPHHGEHDRFTTVRETEHVGKKIRVETTYKIIIDGESLTTHTTVLDDGSVHCHGLPNYSFRSALDMARGLAAMTSTPIPRDELGGGSDPNCDPPGHDPGHDSGHDSGHSGGHS